MKEKDVFTKQKDVLKYLQDISSELRRIPSKDIFGISDKYLDIFCGSDLVAHQNRMRWAVGILSLGMLGLSIASCGISTVGVFGAADVAISGLSAFGYGAVATGFRHSALFISENAYTVTLINAACVSDFYKDFEVYSFQLAWIIDYIMKREEMRNLVMDDSSRA